jgi:hypothetical protein
VECERQWPLATADERQKFSWVVGDVFGNIFRPQPPIPHSVLGWSDGTVPRLARSAYEERQLPSGHLDQGHLAVLADALEEAGCTEAVLMAHLRSPGPHVRGCWAVDLVLSRE